MASTQTHASGIDMFVKIKGTHQGVISGESNDSKHKQEIVALSYSWDIAQSIDKAGSGLATGKRQLGMFKFQMVSQSATPKLLAAAATGEILSEVTITCRKAGKEQQEFMVWKLTNAIVAKVETGYLEPTQVIPHDTITLAFRKIELTYKEQKPDGTLGGGIMFVDDWNI
jgi:type VI secretion system secreted protein Hcp